MLKSLLIWSWLVQIVQADLVPNWQPADGDPIPYGFNVSVLGGVFVLPPPAEKLSVPLLILVHDPDNAASRYLWRAASSTRSFLSASPQETDYLFLSYGLAAEEDAHMMQSALKAAAASLLAEGQDMRAKLDHFHFATVPMSGLSDAGANFLPNLMGRWTSSTRKVHAASTGDWELESERLDSDYEWLPWPPPTVPVPAAGFGDGCRDPVPWNFSGQAAIVSWVPARTCSYAQIVSKAQKGGAAAVLFQGPEHEDVDLMSCAGKDCNLPLTIFATMVPFAATQSILDGLAAGLPVSIQFLEQAGPGYFAAVDTDNRLQQLGWQREPTLMHLAWAGQWLHYTAGLKRRLAEPALVLPIFEKQVMQGEHGIRVNVTLPPAEKLASFTRLALDFELGCPGRLDEDCPIWDHVVQLFVCCESSPIPCAHCDATPWLAQHNAGDPEEIAWQAAYAASANAALPTQPACGRELGRWITPFRRRIGHWLTDATPLLPLLVGGQQCRFTAQTAPWALPWLPSLRLRFSWDDAAGLKPFALQPLFSGGTFDADYNKPEQHQPIQFDTPQGTDRAVLHAFITGHGSDDNNCAEFCPTSHHFYVNGHEHWVNFTNGGTLHGCADRVEEGVEPNEHGTWLYGRDGWCDGQDVHPWLADVSADLKPPEAGPNVIEYKGLYQGHDPSPRQNAGYIMQSSTLSFFARQAGTISRLTRHAGYRSASL